MIRRGVLALFLPLVGCGTGANVESAGNSLQPLRVVYNGIQCPGTEAGVEIIHDSGSWSDWKKRLKGFSIARSSGRENEIRDPDFGQGIVAVISMGSKPTAGFSIDVTEADAVLIKGILRISSTWQQPADGAVLPLVVTAPCVVVTVPAEDYRSVEILNQHGDVVLRQQL
jgi:hypothetical protein